MRRKTNSALRNIRRARTMTQRDLARLLGVSQQTVSKAERELVHLAPDIQTKVAAILGASRQELFPSEFSELAS